MRRERSKAVAALVLMVAALACANLAAARLSLRFDLTEDRIFTLSPASRALVSGLPDELTVKAYISKDLPPPLDGVARYTRELLEEYRLASGGKLRYQVEDPASDPKIDEQAARCHIGKLAFQAKNNNQMSVGAYFLGLCLWYGGKNRALTPIERESGLEYEISALAKRLSQKRRKVAFTVGRGERDLGTDYTFIKRALDPEIEVVTLDPATATISDDVAALVVAGPRRPFDARARGEIERFLRTGRAALFLLDGVEAEETLGNVQLQIVHPIETGLEPLLAAYGFRVGADLVLDPRNVPGPIGGNDPAVPPVFLNFPAFVAARPEAPAAGNDVSITEGIDAVVFPFTSAVERIGRPDATPTAHVWPLARSSAGSWRQRDSFLSEAPAPPDGAARGPSVLAYAYQGPARESAANGASASAAPSVRLVVVGGSSFIADRYMSLMRAFPIYAGGAELFLNAVSWSLEDDVLTALRAHVLRARPLDIDGDAGDRAALLRWGNIAGLPVVICLLGVLRWRWRSAARRNRQRFPGGPEAGR
jgi:ABC-type uncharacterized transport system involved in gliding motility auxiliary subunit